VSAVNYLAHGWRTLAAIEEGGADDAWTLAGTALPDWLRVLGGRMRATPDRAAACVGSEDPRLSSLARGVRRHFDDDAWFHASPGFTEASSEAAALVRPLASEVAGLRPSFVAHVLVEMLLDAELLRREPGRADAYYETLGRLDPDEVERVAAPIAIRAPEGLAPLVRTFLAMRFVADYADDARLAHRLDQVCRRVRQPQIGERLRGVLPRVRAVVAANVVALLPAS
jgi:hypothetical protein